MDPDRSRLMLELKTQDCPDPHQLEGIFRHAYYNGMDCMLTAEIAEKQQALLSSDPTALSIFRFTFGLQRPALKMMLRGIYIDNNERAKMITRLEADVSRLQYIINTYAQALWQRPLNPGSWQQKNAFLYDFLRLPPQRIYDKATRQTKLSSNRACLEKLRDHSLYSRPIILALLSYADVKKALGILRSGVDPDGRMRSSFLVSGTITGRFASRKNAFGLGSNFQNWREAWRIIFAATPGPMPDRLSYNIPEPYRSLPPRAE
jgi:DNA polymerase I-like protein with 3'-5' exonuclease and polymerase domains